MFWLLADATPGDFTGYLLVAIGTLFSACAAGLGWFGKVYMPSRDTKEAAMLMAHAERLDAKDSSLLLAIKEQRAECVAERERQYQMFDATLKRNEAHTAQMHETMKEDLQALTTSLNVLSEAVGQLRAAQKP